MPVFQCKKKKQTKRQFYPPVSFCVSPSLLYYQHTHIPLTPDVGFFSPPTKQLFVTPAGRPTIQLNSDTIYLETTSDPTG